MTPPASLYVIVEGPMDAQLIRAILGKDLSGKLRFFAAGGGLSLATLARNILVHEGGPILLVMDSNTRNQRLVEEQKSMAFIATSGVAPPSLSQLSDWVKVFAFVPEIEVVFFEAPQSLEILVGTKVSQEEVQQGLLAPKATLERILAGKVHYQTMVTSMRPQVVNILTASRQAQALKAAIESMITKALEV